MKRERFLLILCIPFFLLPGACRGRDESPARPVRAAASADSEVPRSEPLPRARVLDPAAPVPCPECGETGRCARCGEDRDCLLCIEAGRCAACGGDGRSGGEACSACDGLGNCPECGGDGRIEPRRGHGRVPGICVLCVAATGQCPQCGGNGTLPGGDECLLCAGEKTCPECEGSGLDVWCDGSGRCGTCDGHGFIGGPPPEGKPTSLLFLDGTRLDVRLLGVPGAEIAVERIESGKRIRENITAGRLDPVDLYLLRRSRLPPDDPGARLDLATTGLGPDLDLVLLARTDVGRALEEGADRARGEQLLADIVRRRRGALLRSLSEAVASGDSRRAWLLASLVRNAFFSPKDDLDLAGQSARAVGQLRGEATDDDAAARRHSAEAERSRRALRRATDYMKAGRLLLTRPEPDPTTLLHARRLLRESWVGLALATDDLPEGAAGEEIAAALRLGVAAEVDALLAFVGPLLEIDRLARARGILMMARLRSPENKRINGVLEVLDGAIATFGARRSLREEKR